MSVQYQVESENEPQDYVPEPRQPFPVVTAVIIAAIVAVFAAQMVVGLDPSVEVAGFDKPAFIQKQEYWRILTGAALHGGPLHVFMNCYAFYSFGKIFELISNRLHVATVFLLAAVGGGLLSLAFLPGATSVGASGGILGIVGYLAIYAFRRRQFVSPEFRKGLLINIGFILIFGLVLYQQIDNFGHIGGLLVGVAYGLVQIPTDEYVDPRQIGPVGRIAGFASVAVYLAVCAFSILLMLRIV